MHWAVVMAGGSGTRFWPLSNPAHPKQFLRLIGSTTPAESCIARLRQVIPDERIIIAASHCHRDILHKVLPNFPSDQILFEPAGRNTAACIAWATSVILSRDPDARIGVFPSDHFINDTESFRRSLERAYRAAEGQIVLFGIVPTRPDTGFGYIEQGEKIAQTEEIGSLYRAASFREKPDLQTAKQFIEDGRFLWNSGMFIYDGRTMMDEIRTHVPQIADKIEEIRQFPDRLDAIFPTIMSISIDYAVMEQTKRAAVLRADFPWDDIGTWDAVRRYYPQDAQENRMRQVCDDQQIIFRHAHGNFAFSNDGRTIAVLGLNNVIVVSAENSVLVMDASYAQYVREIADIIKG